MPPIQPRYVPAAIAALVATSAATIASDDDDDSSQNTPTPKERAHIKAELIFAIVLAYLVIMAICGSFLWSWISSCCRDRARIRARVRARKERMQARNGLGWFDRWTISPVRRSNRVQRRRTSPTHTVLPVPSAEDYRRMNDDGAGGDRVNRGRENIGIEVLPEYALVPPNSPIDPPAGPQADPSIERVLHFPRQAHTTAHPEQRPNQNSRPSRPSHPSQFRTSNRLPAHLSSPAPSYRSRDAYPPPPPYHPDNDHNV
ncbi:hypothetical protein F503_02130 [Ophiostoma piceae UAMH 11346]|uniref:Uncharacterized protein n=1 Tax=Ophiostoma piceae (strain UAMH 11346) TaxID=1262450 RepID=S3C104_OPHP1|nr:hypothetical protein F503_02130 [Ophiostoma piceae UAMH 11346]